MAREITLDLGKNLTQNASHYFDESKAAKKKAQRVRDALKITEQKKKDLESKQVKMTAEKKQGKKRTLEWFEKFRWFYTSTGFLVICGRDAKQNEQIVKKYMDEHDVYFHAEFHGAPHCVLKSEGKPVDTESKREAAEFAGLFSKAWQSSLASVDVYSVKPEQVSKKAQSGESLSTGAFMIYGTREWFKHVPMMCWVGMEKVHESYRIISGPESAVRKHGLTLIKLIQGSDKPGQVAKQVKKMLELKVNQELAVPLDEVIRMMPAGNCRITKGKE